LAEIIIGRNPVLEALRAGRPLSRLLIEQGVRDDPRLAEIMRVAGSRDIAVERVQRRVLDAECSFGVHQGVLAYGSPRPTLDLDDLIASTAARNETPFYVVLDGIEDPHNLGAILRTAEATGVHGVITRSHRAVGLSPAAMKAAAGAAEYVPLVQVANVSQAIDTLKGKGIWTVGIDGAAKDSYLSIDYRPPTAIVVGAEGRGISPLVRRKCDFLAAIRMHGKITSLNASVAAAVVFYEVVRQRAG
jgi:23S rRNA (guanosine2251-2'-O)-methyltransferase